MTVITTFHSFLPTLLLLLGVSIHVLAQTLVKGQSYTNGLSIIDSPFPGNPYHAGSNMPIAIEVSGDGKIPLSAVSPGSGLSTSYESLDIYLVSSQTGLNITVSQGPQLLTGESGSVRHLDWSIPSCVTKGLYNLTFYELSYVNNTSYFIVTPISVSIENDSASTSCTASDGANSLQTQPQPSSSLTQSPFLPGKEVPVMTSIGVQNMLTITVSEGAPFPPSATAKSGTPSSVTLVIVSVETVTATELAQNSPITTGTTWTTTAVMNTQDLSGFFPVNASSAFSLTPGFPISFLFGIWTLLLVSANFCRL